MTVQNDLDRTLDGWFHGDATTAPPPEPLARAIETTRDIRPRRALVARAGSAWTDADSTGVAGAALRPALVLALVALLALALAGGALFVGSRLVPTRPVPAPFSQYTNGVIAVEKDGDIFVADRPGGELRPLVAGPEDDAAPRFMPDGTKLVFVRGGALMLADADGTNAIEIAPEGQVGRIAPDGGSVVGLTRDDTYGIEVRPLEPGAEPIDLDIALHDGYQEIVEWGGPLFRPVNSQEILVVGKLAADGPRGIYVYDLARGGIRTVAEPAGYIHDVKWSADGNFISYDLTAEGGDLRARLIEADGSGDRLLDNAPGTTRDHQVSAWSNDGDRIVMARWHEGEDDWRPVVVSLEGYRAPVALACDGSTGVLCPRSWFWSPDDSVLVGLGGGTRLLADPVTGTVTRLDWDVELNDPQQWQRVAP